MKAILFPNSYVKENDIRTELFLKLERAIKDAGDESYRYEGCSTYKFADVAMSWGIRPTNLAVQRAARHVVIEQGFIGDRKRERFYFGYSALNGCGKPLVSPTEKKGRGEEFYHLLKPSKITTGRVIVLGQVFGDTSLDAFGDEFNQGRRNDVYQWLLNQIAYWHGMGYEVGAKAHPHDPISNNQLARSGAKMFSDLSAAFEWADIAVAFNSNSLTDAFLAGLYVVPSSIGSLTWDVRSSPNRFRTFTIEERRSFVDYVCCHQWRVDQLKEVWEAIKNNG